MQHNLKICAVGGTQDLADELVQAARYLLENDIDTIALTPAEIKSPDMADIFFTMPTRTGELEQLVPKDKIIGFEVVPSTNFFVQVAQIPKGEKVYVFHNNKRGGETFIKNCQTFGINNLIFEIIPFKEMNEKDLTSLLQQSKYLIGAETSMKVLHKKYQQYLQPSATVIKAERIPSLSSGAALMSAITSIKHKKLANQVFKIVQTLTDKLQSITFATDKVSASIEEGATTLTNLQLQIDNEVNRIKQIITTSHSLEKATQDIGTIADTIRRISDQTNLLALNATIEAARVGEQGRGFAVVAKEVGKLAQESKQSIETIRHSVSGIVNAVNQIVPAQREISAAMTSYNENFAHVVTTSAQEKISLLEIKKELHSIKLINDELSSSAQNLVHTK